MFRNKSLQEINKPGVDGFSRTAQDKYMFFVFNPIWMIDIYEKKTGNLFEFTLLKKSIFFKFQKVNTVPSSTI